MIKSVSDYSAREVSQRDSHMQLSQLTICLFSLENQWTSWDIWAHSGWNGQLQPEVDVEKVSQSRPQVKSVCKTLMKKTSEKSFCHYNWTEKQVAPHNSLASRNLRAGTKTGLCIFSRLFQDHNKCIMKLEFKCSCPDYQACKPQASNPSIMFANV